MTNLLFQQVARTWLVRTALIRRAFCGRALVRVQVAALLLIVTLLKTASAGEEPPRLIEVLGEWSQLAPLPDEFGFAGPFAGVSDDALIVAGGANFPGGPPWDGHAKEYHNRIFVLPDPRGDWIPIETRLPAKLAYGVSITVPQGVICIGGCDADTCSRRVFVMSWDAEKKTLSIANELAGKEKRAADVWPLPELPEPLAFMGGAIVGDVIYLAGGRQTMAEDAKATRIFWQLDLSKRFKNRFERDDFKWEALPWPDGAAPRILPVTAAQAKGGEPHFYMLSGRDRPGGPDARLLTDAWAFSPATYAAGRKAKDIDKQKSAWARLAPCPRCLMAGSGTAVGIDHVLVIGGDDGEFWKDDLRDAHPGFAKNMLFVYHTLTDTWVRAGELKANHVTTTAVRWKDKKGRPAVVIPSGEIRPAVRSPAVLVAPLSTRKASFSYLDYGVLIAYLAALVGMGFYFSRREKGTEDFFLAGRRIPWWAAGLSIFGTQLSAITFMAIPAKTYTSNWVFFLQNMGIVAIAPLVAYVYLPFFRRLNVTTAYEYLERRFSLGIRLVGSGAFVAFQLGRMGIVVYLPALALSAVTGWNVYACIAVMGILATIYTVLGGIEAVIWTDVLQVVVLLGGAVIALAIIVSSVGGGIGEVFTVAAANDKLRLANWNWDFTSEALIVILIGAVFNNIVPYTTDQAVIQRYLTTSDERQARQAIWTNAVLTIPASLLFFAVGTALWVFYRSHPAALAPLNQGDQIFPWFIAQELPIGIAGLVIAGVFAAAMSSLDSSMNSVATACVTDFYRRFRPEAPDQFCLKLARWLTLVLGLLGTGTAMWMASTDIDLLWNLFFTVIGLLGGTLAGLFALGIFSRRAAAIHAWIGVLVSAVALGLVYFFTPLSGLLYAAVGATSCIIFAYLASLVIPAAAKTHGLTVFDNG